MNKVRELNKACAAAAKVLMVSLAIMAAMSPQGARAEEEDPVAKIQIALKEAEIIKTVAQEIVDLPQGADYERSTTKRLSLLCLPLGRFTAILRRSANSIPNPPVEVSKKAQDYEHFCGRKVKDVTSYLIPVGAEDPQANAQILLDQFAIDLPILQAYVDANKLPGRIAFNLVCVPDVRESVVPGIVIGRFMYQGSKLDDGLGEAVGSVTALHLYRGNGLKDLSESVNKIKTTAIIADNKGILSLTIPYGLRGLTEIKMTFSPKFQKFPQKLAANSVVTGVAGIDVKSEPVTPSSTVVTCTIYR